MEARRKFQIDWFGKSGLHECQLELNGSCLPIETALVKAVSLNPSIVMAVSTIFQLFVCFL